jgi:hypothetical protein
MPRPGLCRRDVSGVLQGPQNMGLRADVPFNMRHSPGTSEQVYLKEGDLGASRSRIQCSKSGLQHGVGSLRPLAVLRFRERGVGPGERATGRLALCRPACTNTMPRRRGSNVRKLGLAHELAA